MTGRRTARSFASNAPCGIGAASEPSPSTGRSFRTMAISSSTSIIRRGATTKTIPQPPRAWTNERCAEIAARVPKRPHGNAALIRAKGESKTEGSVPATRGEPSRGPRGAERKRGVLRYYRAGNNDDPALGAPQATEIAFPARPHAVATGRAADENYL